MYLNFCASEWSIFHINLHGYCDVVAITNKYLRSLRVRYNQIWQFKFFSPQMLRLHVDEIQRSLLQMVFIQLLWRQCTFDIRRLPILLPDPGVNFTNILQEAFSYEIVFWSFCVLAVWIFWLKGKLWQKLLSQFHKHFTSCFGANILAPNNYKAKL